jgi:hypothetical protein
MSSHIGIGKPPEPKSRIVQAVYQMSATLLSEQLPDLRKRFEEARSLSLWWLNRRLKKELGRGIPPPAWSGSPFEIDQHGQLYAAVTIPDLNLWTCRMEHDDTDVPARTWSVDLALREVGSEVILMQRTLCVSPANCLQFVPLSVPKIIHDLVTKIGLADIVPITSDPWRLTTPSDLDLLELLLSDSSRRLPVVMLTEADETAPERSKGTARNSPCGRDATDSGVRMDD